MADNSPVDNGYLPKEVYVEMSQSPAPAPRTPLNIAVHFRRSYARNDVHGILKNISVTGAFLAHKESAFQPGDKIHMQFDVSGRVRIVQASVIWSNSFGSGVKFNPHNNRDIQIVDDLIYFVENKRSSQKSILDKIYSQIS